MIHSTLIIECGGSKWDFAFINGHNNDVQIGVLGGYNPYSHDEHVLENNLVETLKLIGEGVERFIYYGSGADNEMKKKIHLYIDKVFPNAEIEIHSDLTAISHGMAHGSSGWMGILGTGSNLAYWDGQSFSLTLPSFGYLIGDEGSGRSMIREVMKNYYRGGFGKEMTVKLNSIFASSYAGILAEIYNNPGWLELSKKYMEEMRTIWSHPEILAITRQELDNFMEKQLHLALHNIEGPIFLVGSVAYAYKDYICSWWKSKCEHPITIRRSAIHSLIEMYRNER